MEESKLKHVWLVVDDERKLGKINRTFQTETAGKQPGRHGKGAAHSHRPTQYDTDSNEVASFAQSIRKHPADWPGASHGAASQIRTGDLILTKDALYRLSYSSIFH